MYKITMKNIVDFTTYWINRSDFRDENDVPTIPAEQDVLEYFGIVWDNSEEVSNAG